MATERVAVSLSPEAAAALDDLTRRWFGNAKSAAVEWAVMLAATVAAKPGVLAEGVPAPTDALTRYGR